jgi:hypothetical protein
MPRHQEVPPSSAPIIPIVTCPRCRTAMRLASIEPGAMTRSGQDTLVFQCMTCAHGYRRALER